MKKHILFLSILFCCLRHVYSSEVKEIENKFPPQIHVITLGGKIYCISLEHGKIRWSHETDKLLETSISPISNLDLRPYFLMDPFDGSLHSIATQLADLNEIKKLPISLEELVFRAPSLNSHGFTEMGFKKDIREYYDKNSKHKIEPVDERMHDLNDSMIFLTKSIYSLSIYEEASLTQVLNITYTKYYFSDFNLDLNFLFLISSSGYVAAVNSVTMEIIWKLKLDSLSVHIFIFSEHDCSKLTSRLISENEMNLLYVGANVLNILNNFVKISRPFIQVFDSTYYVFHSFDPRFDSGEKNDLSKFQDSEFLPQFECFNEFDIIYDDFEILLKSFKLSTYLRYHEVAKKMNNEEFEDFFKNTILKLFNKYAPNLFRKLLQTFHCIDISFIRLLFELIGEKEISYISFIFKNDGEDKFKQIYGGFRKLLKQNIALFNINYRITDEDFSKLKLINTYFLITFFKDRMREINDSIATSIQPNTQNDSIKIEKHFEYLFDFIKQVKLYKCWTEKHLNVEPFSIYTFTDARKTSDLVKYDPNKLYSREKLTKYIQKLHSELNQNYKVDGLTVYNRDLDQSNDSIDKYQPGAHKSLSLTVFLLTTVIAAFIGHFVSRMYHRVFITADSAAPIPLDDEGNYKIGKIIYNVNEMLGKGSEGTCIYKGSFDHRNVAVKRIISNSMELVQREIELLQESDLHPNVIRYFCMERDSQFFYIALEYFDYNLHQYVLEVGDESKTLTDVSLLEQIMSGLGYLHKLRIIHRDIKPHNVLINGSQSGPNTRAVISDFGLCKKLPPDSSSLTHQTSTFVGSQGWIAPEIFNNSETITNSCDIFSMGCVFYFVLSKGNHPFGDELSRQSNINNNIMTFEHLPQNYNSEEMVDLLNKMLSPTPSERLTALQVLSHIFFWNLRLRSQFIQDISNFTEKCPLNNPFVKRLELKSIDIVRGSWIFHIPIQLQDSLLRFRGYNYASVRDFLRAIRNKVTHFKDSPEKVRNFFSNDPDNVVYFFIKVFPKLMIHVYYAALEHNLDNTAPFNRYFVPSDKLLVDKP